MVSKKNILIPVQIYYARVTQYPWGKELLQRKKGKRIRRIRCKWGKMGEKK